MNKILLLIIIVVLIGLYLLSLNSSKNSPENEKDRLNSPMMVDYANKFSDWQTDFQQVLKDAKNKNRNILMLFTGSDWCPGCIRLERTVLSSEKFKVYANENLTLMLADFPQRMELPKQIIEQNNLLSEQFQVDGFPTFVVLNPDGKEIFKMDGFSRDPEDFIHEYENLLRKRK